jgi:hypothetical protein
LIIYSALAGLTPEMMMGLAKDRRGYAEEIPGYRFSQLQI